MSRPLHYVGWSDVAFSKTGTVLPIRFVLKSQIKKYWSIWPRGRQSFNFPKIIGTLKIHFFLKICFKEQSPRSKRKINISSCSSICPGAFHTILPIVLVHLSSKQQQRHKSFSMVVGVSSIAGMLTRHRQEQWEHDSSHQRQDPGSSNGPLSYHLQASGIGNYCSSHQRQDPGSSHWPLSYHLHSYRPQV